MAAMPPPKPASETAEGLDALQRGDAAGALRLFDAAAALGDLQAQYGAALAARALSKFDRCLAAIDAFLQREPEHVEAQIIKADALAGLGRRRAAAGFYMAALQRAAQAKSIPPRLASELTRAQKACQEAQALFEQQMRDRMHELGVDGGGKSRMEQAVDIMFGRKKVFLQSPQKFFFPELPHVQFYDPRAFDWAKKIEAAKNAIKAELRAILSQADAFEAYVKHNPIAPMSGGLGLHEDKRWSAFHLVKEGAVVAENASRCPKTMAALEAAPIARVPGKSPCILFSRLEPGAHIPPHHGQMNTRLLCHLPLIVPDGCVLRVGNQERAVVEGELMIFDDSIEHEARNTSSKTRIVLIFDIWRPELSEEERALVCAVCEAVDDLA